MENQIYPQSSNNPYIFMNTQESFEIDKIQAYFVNDYKMALDPAKSALIKQKIEWLEVITGCETKNRYNVLLKYPNDTYAYVFKCKEQSDCCSRNFVA